MTDHTYAGYTAEQIRAAAEAASPGTWREQRYMSDGKVGYGIVDGGRGLFIGEHRLMPFCETDRRHIVTSQPETVLALLDRIAELEQQQRQMANDMTVIQRIHGEQKAALYGRIAELEADNSEYEAFVNECRSMSPGDDVPLHGLADRMRADKRALRIDAERYRWIRDKERFHVDGECGDAAFSSSMCCAEEFDDAIDAAIDAARAEQKNPAAP